MVEVAALDLDPNVITVGGSWMAPKKLVEAKDWAAIEASVRSAVNAVAAFRARG